MMKHTSALIICTLVCCPAIWGQASTTGSASVSGQCNQGTTGSNNSFVINCGIGAAQGKKLLDITNVILKNQLDPVEVMKKLDEILVATARPAQVVIAPNGIGSIGGTLINPTVNNFGPPEARFTFSEEVVKELNSETGGFRTMKVHVSTDRPVPAAVVGLLFSGPVDMCTPDYKGTPPMLTGTQIQQINCGGPLAKGANILPNSFYFQINAPAAFAPGMELIVEIKSKEVVHVLAAAPTQVK
jgi:hypothetical protein